MVRLPPGPDEIDRRVERHQGLGEIAGIGGDAGLADAEHGVDAVDTFHRGAARAGIALVAVGIRGVAKISAAGALENIAAEARHVADLLAGGELERLRDHRAVAQDRGMLGRVRHAHQRAETKAVAAGFDPAERRRFDRVDVDDGLRPHDVELHEIEQRGAAREILRRVLQNRGRLRGRAGAQRRRRRIHTFEDEGAHGISPSLPSS